MNVQIYSLRILEKNEEKFSIPNLNARMNILELILKNLGYNNVLKRFSQFLVKDDMSREFLCENKIFYNYKFHLAFAEVYTPESNMNKNASLTIQYSDSKLLKKVIPTFEKHTTNQDSLQIYISENIKDPIIK